MSTADKIIRIEEEGTLRFGDYTLPKKEKVEDFPFHGDLLKVKTSYETTRLEKNGLFLYESVPGTSVSGFCETEEGMKFIVEGEKDLQITLELAAQTVYTVMINDELVGNMETNLSGKLSISVALTNGKASVSIKRF